MSATPSSEERVRQGTKVERYKWTMRDEPGKLLTVDKQALHIDHSYQRDDSNEGKILRMASDWSWVACGVISIAHRDGKLWVIDGQHRVLAARRRADIKTLPCIQFETESNEEEAKGFLSSNTDRKPITAPDRHRALLVTGDEPANVVQAMADYANRKVARTSGPNTIACISLLRKQVVENQERIVKLWPLIISLCQDQVLNEKIVGGLYYLESNLDDQTVSLADARWTKRLMMVGYDKLLVGANRAAALYARGSPRQFAQGMLEVLNSGLQNKLKMRDPAAGG